MFRLSGPTVVTYSAILGHADRAIAAPDVIGDAGLGVGVEVGVEHTRRVQADNVAVTRAAGVRTAEALI